MSSEIAQDPKEAQDCAVCLQKCHYPTQLPCGHIFCFLCVKGVAIQNKRCAMCRADIPLDYLDNPIILEKVAPEPPNNQAIEGYQWYYEGRNGWWKYDERSNIELEMAFGAEDTHCKLLLAGAVYIVDFQNMVQVQSRDHSRRRRVRRDTPTLPAKGVAGIKMTDNNPRQPTKSESEESHSGPASHNASDSDVEIIENDVELIEILDETQHSQHSEPVEQNHNLDRILEQISSLDFQEQTGTAPRGDIATTEET